MTRFVRTVRYFEPGTIAASLAGWLLVAAGAALAPVVSAVGLAAVAAGVYAAFGFRRWTAALALPGMLVMIVPLVYGLLQPEFEWGGRRYRWTGRSEVEVLR